MKIVYDFRQFQSFYPRGVSRYALSLFTEMMFQVKQPCAILWHPDKVKPDIPEALRPLITWCTVTDFNQGKVSGSFDLFLNGSSTWLGIKSERVLDVVFPQSVLMRCSQKGVMFHDFVPMIFQGYLPTEYDRLNYAFQNEAVKAMDFVFTNSLYTSACVKKYLSLSNDQVTCIYGGADKEKFTAYNSDKPYIPQTRTMNLIAILGGCIRKNALNLTHAFCRASSAHLIPSEATLVLLSCQHFRNDINSIIQQYHLQSGREVSVLEYVPDAEMVDLLSSSRASIFPPVYEGLGLPILESYTAGTPCFASNTSATKEFVPQDSSFNPFDVDDIMKMIIKIYHDDDLCQKNLSFGRRLIQNVNWQHAAQILLETVKASQ